MFNKDKVFVERYEWVVERFRFWVQAKNVWSGVFVVFAGVVWLRSLATKRLSFSVCSFARSLFIFVGWLAGWLAGGWTGVKLSV